MENAIDAGASAIVVEIQRGGMGLIRVTDNGCGIAPEELPTAFLRHATSKLRTAEDLAKIGTLGFRGEALAAISAVSRVDVLTRRPEDAVGAAIHGEGGHMEPVREEGARRGTTIRVSDLFYNTPARLKFMKKDSAETAAVAGLMQHLALSHPDVSFKFIKDGQESLHTPGDGKLESAVYAALGREFAKTLVPVQGRGGGHRGAGLCDRPRQWPRLPLHAGVFRQWPVHQVPASDRCFRGRLPESASQGPVPRLCAGGAAAGDGGGRERPSRQDPSEICQGA